MSRLILPTIFGGVFLVVGLALLILPARVLYNWYSRMRHRQYERLRMVWGDRIGDWLYNRFGSRDIGLKNTATLYRIMGGFVVVFMLCWYTAFASAVIRDAGGLDGTGTVIYEGPIVSAGTSAYLYPNRYPQPKTMNATYPFGTQEVYVIFFAKRIGGGIATYRWGLGGGLQREFSGQYKNGENIVGLNDSTTQPIPEGSHDVYIWEDGELLAIVRFKVVGE